MPYDEDQIPIPDEQLQPNTDGNFVSFQFEQKIDVDLVTKLCKFGFKNPGSSNHNIVVQLQFTDAQAMQVMGSTGRTAEGQKKLSDNPDYDPETYRMVIAESGSIRPGCQLEDLRLVCQPNGATVSLGGLQRHGLSGVLQYPGQQPCDAGIPASRGHAGQFFVV